MPSGRPPELCPTSTCPRARSGIDPVAELFAGRATDEEIVRRLLGPFRELPVDRGVAELGGRVRRESGVGLADALIAATALQHRLSVLTRNTRDFARVPR